MNTVYVLVITTKYGQDISAWTNREKAIDALYEYVTEWWDFDDDLESMPNKESAIDMYFDSFDSEFYDMAELEIK